MRNYISHNMPLRNRQRGVSTLVITILLLVIITLVVLFSTSVGFIEQRTALNENRARIAEQAAETAINLAGETLKANRNLIISNAAGGWLDTTAGNAGWVSCFGVADDATIGNRPHPCRIESDSGRRNELYFYTTNGTGDSIATTRFIASTAVGNVGGAASFPSVVDVQAVLCRIDSSVPIPTCDNDPDSGNRIAVTFIATASLTNESTTAVIKETWASFTDASPSASVPIIGSGFIKGLGTAEVVTNPNAAGYGVPASIWSPNDVGVSGASSGCGTNNNGVGSFSSCQVGEYLKATPLSGLKTTCATTNNACKCPDVNTTADSNYLSGHSTGGVKREGIDILDVDGDKGALPDIEFFPGVNCAGVPMDDSADLSDDSLFEYVFNASDVTDSGSKVTKTGCSPTSNCAVNHLVNNLSATVLPNCSSLGPASSGLYYIEGNCDFPNGNIGSPTSPAIIVVEEEARINNNVIYGLVFVRSNDQSANFRGNGNAKIFGALVVEGDIDLQGSIDIIYDNTGVNSDPNTLPSNAKFARVPGSWLDAIEGF